MGLFSRCMERHQNRVRRICFIEPPYHQFTEKLDAPFALMYLASVAEQCGWQAQIVDMKELGDPLPEADIYAVTSSSPQFPNTVKLERRLGDEFPNALRIVGGNHISAVPENLKQTSFHIGVVGEGENALTDILLGFGSYSLKKQWIVRGKPIENIDAIGFPARHLVDWSNYKRGIYWGSELLAPAVSMITSRGCPYRCVFCGSNVIFGRYTRCRSVPNIISEIKAVIDTLGYHGFNFHDDEFTLVRPRTVKLSKEFAKLGIVWRCLTRADAVDENMLKEMAKGGCKEIILGVESGSQKVLNRICKGTTVKQNLKAMQMVKDAGIQLKAGIMVGSPSETKETVEETKELLRACPPDFWNVSVFTPFPGSAVWKNPKAYGIKILTRDMSQYAMVGKDFKGIVVAETEEMKKEDIEHARDELIDLLLEISPP